MATTDEAGNPPQPINLGKITFGPTIEVETPEPRTAKGNVITLGGAREDLVAWMKRVGFKRWSWVYAPLRWLFRKLKIRFLLVGFPHRIGHLVYEMDTFLKERALGEGQDFRPILLLRRDLSANPALLEHFSKLCTVWSSAWAWRLFSPLLSDRSLVESIGNAEFRRSSDDDRPMIARWGDRPPLSELDPKLREKGRAWLESLGAPRDAWFVALHVRTAGYSPVDEHIQRFRNANIDNYKLAIKEITDRGGYVLRIGDATMRPLKDAGPQVIDVSQMGEREPWTDLFICSEAKFFFGTTSGLWALAKMFGRPCALANMIPYSVALGPTKQDISIPKLILDPNGQPMRFPTIFKSMASRMHSFYDYLNNNLKCVQNTPEELRDLAAEMLDRLDGSFETSEEDEAMQAKFQGYFQPGDNYYGYQGRISRDFLRRHADLF